MKMPSLLPLVFLILATPLSGQTPYIETFELRLHNLDVVVTDAKGNPVRGLTQDDFVVTDDGVSQPITNFSAYDSASGTAFAVKPASPDAGAQAAAAAVTTSAPPPRRIVFFIDELGVQKMVRNRLYENVKQFVDAMGEGDVAAVVRPTAKEKIAQEFTGDRAAIERALRQAIDESGVEFSGVKQEIAALRWQLRNGVGSGQLQRAAKREYSDAAARRVAHRLGQIRSMTSSLAGLDGKKIVVLVSMGLTSKPGSEVWNFEEHMGAITPPSSFGRSVDQFGELQESDDPERTNRPFIHDYSRTIADIATSAAASGVTIYAIEPDVPLDQLIRADANNPGRNGKPDPRFELPPGFHADFLQNSQATLSTLTGITGGRWYRGMTNLDDIFRQVTIDSSNYYSLAYRANGAANQVRSVKVSLRNRPDLRVRTRSEVVEKSTDREMTDLVVASLLYPRPVNELAIAVTASTPKQNRGLFTVPIDVVIPLKNLTFLQGEGGKYVASFDLHYAAAGELRDFGTGGQQKQTIEITPEQYAQIGTINYRYKTGIEVSPGRVRIAIGVIDPTTKLTGFRTVEVLAQ